MDFTKNLVLKENYAFLVADAEGRATEGEHGLYHRDTRFLSRWAWRFEAIGATGVGVRQLMAATPRPDRLETHHAWLEGPSQRVGIRRRARLEPLALHDRLEIANTSREVRTVELALELDTDFADLFEARGWHAPSRAGIEKRRAGGEASFRYTAPDGVALAAEVALSPAPHAWEEGAARWRLELAPGERLELTATVRLDTPLETPADPVPYDTWRAGFAKLRAPARYDAALRRAIDDLRALLLFTEQGPIPAAGIPWFVAAFGRDALLTALMTLPHAPAMAAGTLRYLAAHQGSEHDERSAAAPGKIMHEIRFGELTRTGEVPFGPYYGTVDATPLWIVLLHRLWRATGDPGGGPGGDLELVRELRPALEAALGWMTEHGDLDGDGFLEFRGNVSRTGEGEMTGLAVQSWKDSWDSMSHEDGTLAHGDIAVCEVQGYAYDAFRGAAELLAALGDDGAAAPWRERAERLKRDFHEAFWLDDLGTYAMALDGDKRPLRVHNSDAGQLLWSGVVPEGIAPRLVATLFDEGNWSGWGIRTLGTGEARYNPVSYHNGSVWPHDTALIAGGLVRYGFADEARRIRDATFELAASQPDLRPPELVAGYPREAGVPPVPYPVACRPQAWDAAALVYLADLLA